MSSVKVEAVARDPSTGDYRFFLEMDPDAEVTATRCLDLVDALVDGGVVRVFPDANLAAILVLCGAGAEALAARLRNYLKESQEYAPAIAASPHVTTIAVCSGEMI